MTTLDWLDDDDIIALRRYHPIGSGGLDRILNKLKAAVDHPARQRTRKILTIELDAHIVDYMAAIDPVIYNRDGSNTGAILHAVATAARNTP